jgi:hypothetical protein
MKNLKSLLFPTVSVLLVVIILYYKRPDTFTDSQFYGEEGPMFFLEAYIKGFGSLFNTCAGYFHLYPRLVFCFANAVDLPLEYMPTLSSYGWLFILTLVLIYIWKRIELDLSKKFFIALSTVLIPINSEILMNLTNVQWMMAIFPIIIFSCNNAEKNKKWFWADLLILILTGFTGPNMIILLPLLLFFVSRNYKNLIFNQKQLVLYSIGVLPAILSTVSILLYGSINRVEGKFIITNSGFVEYIYIQYAFLFLGKFAFDTPFLLKCLFILLLLAYSLVMTYKIIRSKVPKAFTIATFIAGILFLITTLISYRNNPSILHPHYGGVRNFYLPAICCIWYFISILKPNNNPALLLFFFTLLLVFENIRTIGRDRLIDYNWSAYAKRIKTSDTLTIPINPQGWHIFIDNKTVQK